MGWRSHVIYLAGLGALIYSFVTGPATGNRELVLHLALLPLAVAAVLLRTRFPHALALLGAIELVLGLGPAVYIVGMLSLSMRCRGKHVWIIAGIAATIIGVLSYRHAVGSGDPWWEMIANAMLDAAVSLLAPLAGTYIRVQRERLESAAEQAVRAEALSARPRRIRRHWTNASASLAKCTTRSAGCSRW